MFKFVYNNQRLSRQQVGFFFCIRTPNSFHIYTQKKTKQNATLLAIAYSTAFNRFLNNIHEERSFA